MARPSQPLIPLVGFATAAVIGAGIFMASGSDDPVIAPAEPAVVAAEPTPQPEDTEVAGAATETATEEPEARKSGSDGSTRTDGGDVPTSDQGGSSDSETAPKAGGASASAPSSGSGATEKPSAPAARAAVLTGPKLPKVQASSTEGRIDFGALRGPAIIHVYASWCSVCRGEAAELGKAVSAAPGVKRIWIAVQDDPQSSEAFQTEFDWPAGPRVDDKNRSVAAKLGLSGQPNTILVDAEGNTQRFAGAVPIPTLTKLLGRISS